MTLEDPPHESPRPPTLEASHLLTGPTGCPGFEFSGLPRTMPRRARHRVTICRELRHSVQIVESEHVVTDRLQKVFGATTAARPYSKSGHGRRRPSQAQAALHNCGMAQRKKRSRKDDPKIPIDKLLVYWIDLSKRPTLTREDFRTFVRMAEQTFRHFEEFYGWRGRDVEEDKFFRGVHTLIWLQENILKDVFASEELTNRYYVVMKRYSKGFVTRIKKVFEQDVVRLRAEKTPVQDAEDLIAASSKLTYRQAAGIVASNHIAALLIRLSKGESGRADDIKTLYANLKNKAKNPKLRTFLTRSYRRFEDADKTRNRCAHVNEGEPTPQEIEQSIQLARLLQRFV